MPAVAASFVGLGFAGAATPSFMVRGLKVGETLGGTGMLKETGALDMWLYPVGTLALLGVWAMLLVLCPDLRRRMPVVGVMGIPMTFEDNYFLQDY